MKATSNYTITKVQRGIAVVFLLCHLLTSCSRKAIPLSLVTEDHQAPLQPSSSSAPSATIR